MNRKLAEFKVRSDKLEEALGVIREFVAAIQANEPGVERYDSFQLADGTRFVHLMEFVDKAAERSHREAPHTLTFVRELYPLCEVEPTFTDIVWTKGSLSR